DGDPAEPDARERRQCRPRPHAPDALACAHAGPRHDRRRDIERAQRAADPDPPGRVAELAPGRQRLEHERGRHEQHQCSDEERHERRAHRAPEPPSELGVDSGLERQDDTAGEREQEVQPQHCARRFRGDMLVPLPSNRGGVMLSFGVTVLPDPPYQRMIELMKVAEDHGFEYAWTYDSHILWEDSYATLPLAAAQTTRIKFGHCVTNPGIRDPTVTASWYATMQDISDGRMVMGIGRGDSSR